MNKLLLVLTALAVSGDFGLGQGVTPLAPSSITPKPVRPETTPGQSPEQPVSPRPNPEGDKPINPDQPNLAIKAVVIVKTREEIQEGGVPSATGLQVRDIPFLAQPDFQAVVEPYLGKLLTENRIRDLEDAIILYSRQHGKVLVDVILPEQNIENGVLQFWFLEGKVGQVTVRNIGKDWFKEKFIVDNVRLRPGDEVDSRKLAQDLNWLNNNPFRQVDVTFKPGERLGMTDVELDVNDRVPFRPYAGVENSGTRFTGPDRLLFGFNWGNAFGLDHQLNYQYATDVDFELVKAHSASYLIPLPWRHTLMLYGAYVDGKADFGSSAPTAAGISWQASARYSVPLPDLQKFRHQVSGGFDLKRSNNNLQFGGTTVLPENDTDIAQFVLGYSGVAPDRFGNTSVGLEAYWSPGGLTAFNTDSDFSALRSDTKADYVYARLNAERLTRLPYNFSWVLRGWAQISNERLLPSEELAVGGFDTVRGYDERVISGDHGWIIDNELRTPPIPFGNLLGTSRGSDQLQFLAFFDYGATRIIDVNSQDLNPNKTLCSVGGGLRYTISRNFSLRFDYGYPLTEIDLNEHRHRVHFGALLSF